MAELVQQRMEEMLQEVEQMERLGILNASETKAILRRRRGYQYKIQRRIKEKDDFLKYIQYECDVLTLINKRRKDLRSEKGKGYIDQPIKHRINRLFTAACKRFPEDVQLWLSHVEFCKTKKQKGSVGAIFTKMLQLHSSKPDIWVVAAKWEMEEMQNMFNTRRLLQRGLRFNPDSQHLWREYYRMELLNSDKLRKRREILQVADMQLDDEEASSAVLEGQVAKLVYCKAVQAIPDDVKFKLSFLPVTQLFDFMEDFEDEIVKSAEESHPDSELTWDIKAHRKWAEAEAIWRNKVLDKKHRVARVESIEAECRELYETAVLRIPKCETWTLYLKFCLEMVEEKAAAKKLRPRRIEAAHSTFRAALAHNAVTEESASFWIKLAQLTRDSSYLLTLTSDLVNGDFKRNVSIWRERLLQVATSEIDDEDEKTRMCEAEMDRALSLVPAKESLPLWNFALEWNVINQPMDKVQALFEKSVTQTPEVAGPCKTAYLKWASLHLDVKAVRKIFKKLSVSQPLSVEFFRTYVDIENSQVNPSMKRIHAAFDSAVSYFGSTDTDLWMDYLRLASLHPMGCPEKVGQIYFKAKNQLDDQHIERFIAQYTLFQAGHSATS